MSAQTYHWCQLRNGQRRTCGYIESRGAKVGAKVRLIDLDNELWLVTRVGDSVSKDFVRDNQTKNKSFGAQEYTTRVNRKVAKV